VSDLLTLHQLARELRIDRVWLRNEALARRIPCLRAGKKFLFSLSAVKETLANRAAKEGVICE
jgi:hypothetical protein